MISKDVASSGKHLKPHSIQILSILRLLSVDRGDIGVEKHLAQILTGQGKSLVLGLSAALLALFNHDIVVVCYSEYLATRDFNDFKDSFTSVGHILSFPRNSQTLLDREIALLSYTGGDLHGGIEIRSTDVKEGFVSKCSYALLKCWCRYINKLPLNDDWIRSFRLDSDGNIKHKDDFGVFRNQIRGYQNSFIYFKLRNNNFVQSSNGLNNFGYLNLSIASYSYSRIPEKFPLILGVTGTLSELTAYEKNVIENHYNISSSSIMPSFFGISNLKYDPIHDFQCHKSSIQWRHAIFSRINAVINAQRAVIVFFDSESEIADFRKDFQSQLDRLNEITINTEAKIRDRYIAEAGLSRTVTLATPEMGRGVDYKSSLSVEKNGGIHVIQTFFSMDVKEETQIKGRTARKDNRGSYELIVCQIHLLKLKLTTSYDRVDTISYKHLLHSRKDQTITNSSTTTVKLYNANETHEKCIKFYRNMGINV
ncbi:uncharacterized protein LOC109622319 [Aedes albopictus]|uniref:SecA DEAD-like N-terminal domain-containing protein n=1 Tax=Aedes albopictus TaxID=7160 RepID=A0ABM1XUK6_AEDAL